MVPDINERDIRVLALGLRSGLRLGLGFWLGLGLGLGLWLRLGLGVEVRT